MRGIGTFPLRYSWNRVTFTVRESRGRFAILVDCENISSTRIDIVLRTVKSFGGEIKSGSLFGDFSSSQQISWLKKNEEILFDKIQASPIVAGKSIVDGTLMIHAMKILPDFESFAIVSSDSDFAPLVLHLQESGKFVVGFGMVNTPSAYTKICNTFVRLDYLSNSVQPTNNAPPYTRINHNNPIGTMSNQDISRAKRTTITALNPINVGWIDLGSVRGQLSQSEETALQITNDAFYRYFKARSRAFDVRTTSNSIFIRKKPVLLIKKNQKAVAFVLSDDQWRAQHTKTVLLQEDLSHHDETFLYLISTIASGADTDGWIQLGKVVRVLSKSDKAALQIPNNSVHKYFKAAADLFDVKCEGSVIYVRVKQLSVVESNTEAVAVVVSNAENNQEIDSADINLSKSLLQLPLQEGASHHDLAFLKVSSIIVAGADTDGWTQISQVGDKLSKSDKTALQMPNKAMSRYFTRAPDVFDVRTEGDAKYVRMKVVSMVEDTAEAVTDIDSADSDFPKSLLQLPLQEEASPHDLAFSKVSSIIVALAGTDGWTQISQVGNQLTQFDKSVLQMPNKAMSTYFTTAPDVFDVRTEGHVKYVRMKAISMVEDNAEAITDIGTAVSNLSKSLLQLPLQEGASHHNVAFSKVSPIIVAGADTDGWNNPTSRRQSF